MLHRYGKRNSSRFYEAIMLSICATLTFSRTFKCNFNLFQSFSSTARPILRHSLLIRVFGSSMEVTGVLYTFPFMFPTLRNHRMLYLEIAEARVLVLPTQSSYWVSYDSNRLLCNCKSVQERHSAEKCSTVSKMQSE